MKTVPLGGKKAAGRAVLVGDDDYDLVTEFPWHVHEDSRAAHIGTVYARTKRGDGKGILMHTLITGWPLVDHQDRNGLNNQRYNLREASGSQNKANGNRYRSSAVFKGVYKHGTRGWYAAIRVNKCLKYLGTFTDPADAARAYDTAALEAWGEFARLNFPAAAIPRVLAVPGFAPMDARDLRDRLGTRIDAARLRQEPTIITCDGEPQAVLISYAEWLATAGSARRDGNQQPGGRLF